MILLRINWPNFVQFSIQLDVLGNGLSWYVVKCCLYSLINTNVQGRLKTGQLIVRFSIIFLTGEIAKKPYCPIKNRTPGNPTCNNMLHKLALTALWWQLRHVRSVTKSQPTSTNTRRPLFIPVLIYLMVLYILHFFSCFCTGWMQRLQIWCAGGLQQVPAYDGPERGIRRMTHYNFFIPQNDLCWRLHILYTGWPCEV